MTTGAKTENRGGARAGAGRKPEALSASQLRSVLREVKRRAKKEKKTITGGLLDMFYSLEEPSNIRISAAKLIWDKTMIQVSEGSEADRALGPSVFLPEHRPVLTAIEGGKGA